MALQRACLWMLRQRSDPEEGSLLSFDEIAASLLKTSLAHVEPTNAQQACCGWGPEPAIPHIDHTEGSWT